MSKVLGLIPSTEEKNLKSSQELIRGRDRRILLFEA
jgi:hypothetical protein